MTEMGWQSIQQTMQSREIGHTWSNHTTDCRWHLLYNVVWHQIKQKRKDTEECQQDADNIEDSPSLQESGKAETGILISKFQMSFVGQPCKWDPHTGFPKQWKEVSHCFPGARWGEH